MAKSAEEGGVVIYTMTIRRNGRVIRRPNGRPFRIVVRPKRKK